VEELLKVRAGYLGNKSIKVKGRYRGSTNNRRYTHVRPDTLYKLVPKLVLLAEWGLGQQQGQQHSQRGLSRDV